MVGSLICYIAIKEIPAWYEMISMLLCCIMISLVVYISSQQESLYGEDAIAVPTFGSFAIGVTLGLIGMPILTFVRVSARFLTHVDSHYLIK